MKKLLTERFQELAGIRPLYQIKKESIFDKVAGMVKGKSDKEQATIDALKKFGIIVGTPSYQFTHVGGTGADGSNSFYLRSNPGAGMKVPMPTGFNDEIAPKEALIKLTLTSIEEVEGVVMGNTVTSQYNFKTGKFEDDKEGQFDMDDPTELEKELDPIDKDPGEFLFKDVKMVPYEDSIWQKWVDKNPDNKL